MYCPDQRQKCSLFTAAAPRAHRSRAEKAVPVPRQSVRTRSTPSSFRVTVMLLRNTLSEPKTFSPRVTIASPAEIMTAAFSNSLASIRSPASRKAVGPEMDAARGDTCMPALSATSPLSKARHRVSTAGSLRSPATTLASVPFLSSRGSSRPGRARQ